MSAPHIPEVSDADVAFGSIEGLLPDYAAIPREFRSGSTKWNRLFNDWFFVGLSTLKLAPKAGVDTEKAMRVIRCCMASFEPKHEHKEAGVAYLLSQWFDDAEWSTGGAA